MAHGRRKPVQHPMLFGTGHCSTPWATQRSRRGCLSLNNVQKDWSAAMTEIFTSWKSSAPSAVKGEEQPPDSGKEQPRDGVEEQDELLPDVRREDRVKQVVAVTMGLVTVWILVCDDLRILLFEKPSDSYFEIVLYACIAIFSLEIILQCLAKPLHFLGFFFWLDMMALGTMVLDLPSVQEEVNAEDATTSGGRSARIVSKSSRIVRIVRIVRVMRMWRLLIDFVDKLIHDKATPPGQATNLDDDWDEADSPSGDVADDHKESRVSQKLNGMVIRRLMLLVLGLLLVPAFLFQEGKDLYSPSGFFGVDEIAEVFPRTGSDDGSRLWYERMMLRYLYYHNWFTGASGCSSDSSSSSCPAKYYGQVFWMGFRGRNATYVRRQAQLARIRAETVSQWERNVSQQGSFIYSYGGMPAAAQRAIAAPWDTDCSADDRTILGVSLLASKIPDLVDFAVQCPSDLRRGHVAPFFPRAMNRGAMEEGHPIFYFDMRPYFREEALLSLMLTAFLCVALCVVVMAFASDANRIVVYPLEEMIRKVEAIRAEPLRAVHMADSAFRREELQAQGKTFFIRNLFRCEAKQRKASKMMETGVLEKTIIKLGSLLALGFGQAGVNIICQNMALTDAGVNVMIPGQRVECIIGHAVIPHFAVATEVLQSKIMSFVNRVAEIVHGIVDEFLGAANKNTGDTFLVVWVLKDPDMDSRQADMSIVAFSKIKGAIAKSPKLADYRGHPMFKQRLGSKYRVELHMGLHAGWAIEGAVGSEFKIDASYISPNVSIAESIAYASEFYGVSLLASEAVVTHCHQECRKHCRVIDRVLIPGSAVPMELYCIDLDISTLQVQKPTRIQWNPRQRFRVRQFLEVEKRRKMDVTFQPCHLFHTDPMLVEMQKPYTEEFQQVFKMGYKNYLEGQWMCAKTFLLRTYSDWGFEDGPSEALLHFIEDYHFVAPEDWPGYHSLDCFASASQCSSPDRRRSSMKQGTLTSAAVSLAKFTKRSISPTKRSSSILRRRSTNRRTVPISEEESPSGSENRTLPDRFFQQRADAPAHRASVQASPVLPPKGDCVQPEWQWAEGRPAGGAGSAGGAGEARPEAARRAPRAESPAHLRAPQRERSAPRSRSAPKEK
eukprot:CAMPEP_0204578058 /NCGR_PEP_ID=MMETSP0661-20131031/42700_1 /ASSEMBLY_ACC=CAM_ASM_000606 /TAXON_ID=109239 /ORGANISM="Alexandrium margalefi, Strain AMGDE01CS-322" /LENGTH=1116 /DNA_ID=CAMNT_0051586951 /DNA_START=40 /DNA_END=3389 /DNA_ORIENTATION=+